jgi:hypothetical protein
MNRTYGAPVPNRTDGSETLRLRFFDGPLELNWGHCGATAEFLGDFNADIAALHNLDANDARHSIAYLTNELLENAVKFRAGGEVALESSLTGDKFALQISNDTAPETAARFGTLLAELTSRDAGDLLIERIEANAADPGAGGSGLGILTLMNDYGAAIGWTFAQTSPDAHVHIDTVATLTLA